MKPVIDMRVSSLFSVSNRTGKKIRQVINMLSIAVCDDDMLDGCNMIKRVKAIMEARRTPCLVRQFCSGQELLEDPETFDIIFLDILMEELNGLQTAELIRKQGSNTILIFITSSRDYVFDAFDVEAFQYLIKPVDDKRLKGVLEHALYKLEPQAKDFILISRDRQKLKIVLDDVWYFEGRGRQIYVHGKEGEIGYYGQISLLEEQLQGKNFFRCHKSYLVNLNYVEGYNRQEAVLDNGEHIMIAKRRYEDFCKAMLDFIRKNGGVL